MNQIDSGDTTWLLVSTAFVMLMTPAVGFFYGGMVRQKNVLAMMGQSMVILALISLQWFLVGYSLSFAAPAFPWIKGWIGSLDWFALNKVTTTPFEAYAAGVPHLAFMLFQCMFAVITPALIIGAFADRVKLDTFILFTLLWSTLVYDPVAHWVWAEDGWLKALGSLDFAGGTVVHITAGASALASAMIIGKRLGFGEERMPAHNIPFTILGGALLWFGWFGFNAGSALGDESLAVHVAVTTNLAAAAAAIAWIVASRILKAKPSVSGIIIGSVAGLVAITPACGFVSPVSAVIIGFVSGILCYLAMNLRGKLDVDDSLDVLACHGIGGIWGAIATGLFAEKAINAAGANGLLFGNSNLLWIQLLAVLVTIVYSFLVTSIILFILKKTVGLRVSVEEERQGLDISQHGEEAYVMLPIGDDDSKALQVLEAIKVSEVMNIKVRTASLDDDLEKIQDLMLEKQHFALPVVDDNRHVLGIITIADVRKIDKSDRKNVKVKKVYTKEIQVAYPEESIHDLIQRMQEKHISNLPVIQSDGEKKLVGIISKTDLIKAYKNIASEGLKKGN
ncbi:MAG: ammonium transporter [Candidatus Caenarcaniphilales bacterium]|nr:ammonium transporter [Candidatus Caenarcaniphilales bacterium]